MNDQSDSIVRDAMVLEDDWTLAVRRTGRSEVAVRLAHPTQRSMTVEIEMTSTGPVVRVHTASLEVEATEEIALRCRRLSIDASERLDVRAGTVEQVAHEQFCVRAAEIELRANDGDVRLDANDDVQLLGESILLNCDRPEPPPRWVPLEATPECELTRTDALGDAVLLEELGRENQGGDQ